jgi:sugar fermentation stimulation protein A
MQFRAPLVPGRFLRRYKRFFADMELAGGERVVAHCPNTGSLLGCLEAGAPVWLLPTPDPRLSLRYRWTLVQVGRSWVVVDTALAVPVVEDAIAAGLWPELAGFERSYREIRYGRELGSRIDLLLSRGGELPPAPRGAARAPRPLPAGDERVYVEVKSTTLTVDGLAMFPDAVTERGQKHLTELMHVVAQGQRAAMVYCVQRGDCEAFAPADHIDPEYGRLLREAIARGVEVYVLRTRPLFGHGTGPEAHATHAAVEGVTADVALPLAITR